LVSEQDGVVGGAVPQFTAGVSPDADADAGLVEHDACAGAVCASADTGESGSTNNSATNHNAM
jgi:hypothetical protein